MFWDAASSIPIQRLGVLCDEGEEGADTGVDTRVSRSSAAVAERNDTDKGLGGIDKRAARVPLARVLATGGKTSADHVVGDGRAVAGAAAGAGHDGNADLVEGVGAAATGAESAPAGNGDGGTGSRVRARGWEADVFDGVAGGDGGRQLPDGNIVVLAGAAVVGVNVDGGDSDDSATRGAAQGTGADGESADGANDGAHGAVSSSDNSVAVDERTTADVGSADLERDNVGELARGSGGSTNNVLIRSVGRELDVGVLGSRNSKSERWERESDDGLETHDEDAGC